MRHERFEQRGPWGISPTQYRKRARAVANALDEIASRMNARDNGARVIALPHSECPHCHAPSPTARWSGNRCLTQCCGNEFHQAGTAVMECPALDERDPV